MTSSIEEHFSQLEAPRVERNQLHGCVDIPILVICVENRLHWRLDVVFREDTSRIRKGNAPAIMTAIRHLCMNLY